MSREFGAISRERGLYCASSGLYLASLCARRHRHRFHICDSFLFVATVVSLATYLTSLLNAVSEPTLHERNHGVRV
jgi:hypothetical protein